MSKIIGKKFFDRKTLTVARNLAVQYLVRKIGKKIIRERITEVEAYVGPQDLACHASRGRTPRTETMFCPAGTIYVYFVYGMHYMLNIVTEGEGYPAAVLIRGTENFKGPGVLTRELRIDKKLNGKKVSRASGLWLEYSEKISGLKKKIKSSPRIGVNYAGPIWSQKKYRFTID